MQPDYNLAVFGGTDWGSVLPVCQKQVFKAGMVATKKIMLLKGKSPSPACFKMWVYEMLSVAKMEQNAMVEVNLYKKCES